ncbi:hypothetical protein YC2023_019802 [Brassica napus]
MAVPVRNPSRSAQDISIKIADKKKKEISLFFNILVNYPLPLNNTSHFVQVEVFTSSLRRDRRSKCCLFFITRSPYPKNPEDISDLCFHTAKGISRIFLPDKGFNLGMSERIGGELLHDEEKVQLVMIMSTTTSPTRSCFFE